MSLSQHLLLRESQLGHQVFREEGIIYLSAQKLGGIKDHCRKMEKRPELT